MGDRLARAVGAGAADVEPVAAGRETDRADPEVDSAPEPLDDGVTDPALRVSWPAPIAAGRSEQSVKLFRRW